ncbi:hypothetical protein HYY27_08150 [bacterium]|nr:hypothetical protein [bacterium]
MRRDTILFVGFVALFAAVNAYLLSVGKVRGDWAGFGVIVAAGLTLAMYSFLYRDNPTFKLAEHLYVGVVAAYQLAQYWYNNLLSDVYNPLFRPEPGKGAAWGVLIPTALGLMMLTRFVPKISPVSRISFAFFVGVGAGLSIPRTISSFLLQQIEPTFKPIWTASAGFTMASLDTFLILLGVVSVLVYFSFSIEHRGAVGGVSRVGIWFLMISFGASFGYTIMARLSLLIGRMTFLLRDWLHVQIQ